LLYRLDFDPNANTSNSSGDGIGTVAIIGIVVGAIFLIGIVVICIFLCCRVR